MPHCHDRSVPRRRVNAGDTRIDRRGRQTSVPAILSYGFRPFFLLGAAYAALLVPLWIWAFLESTTVPGNMVGVAWHRHEMLFGYLAAVMAGFVLTAVPNWTGRLPISGMRLLVLTGLWFLGRIAMSVHFDPLVAALADLAFPSVLAAAVWREILAGRNYRNIPVGLLLTIFGLANLLDHAGQVLPPLADYGIRMVLSVAAMMIALIGGRVTPSFTRNWMARHDKMPLPMPFGRLDQLALAASAIGLLLWVIAPDIAPTGVALILAGLLLLARLVRWRGHRAMKEPIVLILHLGYLWLAVALCLLGIANVDAAIVPVSAAIHALAAGAIGTMTLAIMTRASRGHTGRPISADAGTLLIYVLASAGAVSRVSASFFLDLYEPLIIFGGTLWSLTFATFVVAYAPMLMRRSAR